MRLTRRTASILRDWYPCTKQGVGVNNFDTYWMMYVEWDTIVFALTTKSVHHISAAVKRSSELLLSLAVSLILLWHQSSKDLPWKLEYFKQGSNLWGGSSMGTERSDIGWQAMASATGQPITCLNSVGAEVEAANPWEQTEWHWLRGGSQPSLTDTSHPGCHLALSLPWHKADRLYYTDIRQLTY